MADFREMGSNGAYPQEKVTDYVVYADGRGLWPTVQHAVDAASEAGGGLVYLPDAAYAQTVVAKKGVTLRGSHEQMTRITGVAESDTLTINVGEEDPGNPGQSLPRTTHNFSVENLMITGQGDQVAVVVNNEYAQEVFLRDVRIHGNSDGASPATALTVTGDAVDQNGLASKLSIDGEYHIWNSGANTEPAIVIDGGWTDVRGTGEVDTGGANTPAISLTQNAAFDVTKGHMAVTGQLSLVPQAMGRFQMASGSVITAGNPAFNLNAGVGLVNLGDVTVIAGDGTPDTGVVAVDGTGVIAYVPSKFVSAGFTTVFAGTLNFGGGAAAGAVESEGDKAGGGDMTAAVYDPAAKEEQVLTVSDALSDADIKTAYENNADTNAFTDADEAKLDGIEAGATADQSDAEIETAYNNQVAQVSNLEKTAGTEVGIRRFSPLDIAEMAGLHGMGGGGEVNTASNQGTTGVGVFDNKDGVDLEFRNITDAGSNRITTNLDAVNKNIEIDVSEANLSLANLGGALQTEQLESGVETPGNSKYYGTNETGSKGFYDLPSGGSSSLAGFSLGSAVLYEGTDGAWDTFANQSYMNGGNSNDGTRQVIAAGTAEFRGLIYELDPGTDFVVEMDGDANTSEGGFNGVVFGLEITTGGRWCRLGMKDTGADTFLYEGLSNTNLYQLPSGYDHLRHTFRVRRSGDNVYFALDGEEIVIAKWTDITSSTGNPNRVRFGRIQATAVGVDTYIYGVNIA